MAAFLILDSISLATPDGRSLFDGLTFALGRERIGVVGRNGCGKSTLLRLVAGDIEPSGGSLQRIGRIGMLAQLVDERLRPARRSASPTNSRVCTGSKVAKVRSTTPRMRTGRCRPGYRRR